MDEQKVRNFALHLATEIRRQGTVLILRNRYGNKKTLGQYRSFAAIDRALQYYCGDAGNRARGKWW